MFHNGGLKETLYGFDWEAARVERVVSVQRKKKDKHRWVCVTVRNALTDDYRNKIDVYVSPSGRSIRAFRDGKELK